MTARRHLVDIVWDGVLNGEILSDDFRTRRHELADACEQGHWPRVLERLREYPELANCARLDDSYLDAPLHHAARAAAPARIIRQLAALGAFRLLRNRLGERPLDIARALGHRRICRALEPVILHEVDPDQLIAVQARFHQLIREQTADLRDYPQLRLPELDVLRELATPKMWCPVPGMYGGFSYWLEIEGPRVQLVAESSSRMEWGPPPRYIVTAGGSTLVEEGFV